MARALIVGCGCRGRELGRVLSGEGWRVRGTSRDPRHLDRIERAGFEAAEADPDRPGTILELCGDVSVVVWLLGSAVGEQRLIEAIHGPRLERLMEKLVDSPVRGFAYEVAGTVEPDLLAGGRAIAERAAGTWRIPVAFIDRPGNGSGWAEEAGEAVRKLLAA
ncbi:MAG TPA: hypothetical protein VFY33_03780 [Solirubrobacterales bacterium]|nr:hypothetical protein [Solirubrobacterales bacterium]